MKHVLSPRFWVLCLLILATPLWSVAQTYWSSSATWPKGRVPSADEDVVIPAGQTITLDATTPVLGKVTINGTLVFEDQADVALSARSVIVMGSGAALQIGTPEVLYRNRTSITLYGNRSGGTAPANKGIMVMDGGSLRLHGASRDALDWTVLSQSVSPGDNALQLTEAPNWQPGDQIVLAPSGYDPREAEQVTITAIAGKTVSFSPAAQYQHYSGLETHAGKTLDMRAEVGLLTRNILIQGDENSVEGSGVTGEYPRGFGGHIMVMEGAGPVACEGVELYRMGQTRIEARYPFHWHLAGDCEGDYFRHNSIHESFHRGIVTHGTSNVQVESNVGYNVLSHMYVPAEDGTETGNVYRRNLGVLAWRVDYEDEAFDHDDDPHTDSRQQEHRSGVFWLTNWNNVIEDNHAAGSYFGMGFFYDIPPFAHYDNWNVVFSGNVAHSSYSNTNGQVHYPPNTRGHGLFLRENFRRDVNAFTDFTAYKNTLSGVWMEERNHLLTNSIMAENGVGFFTIRGNIENSVIVGKTNNPVGIRSNPGPSLKGAITILGHEGKWKDMHATNVTVIDYPTAAIVWDHYHVVSPSWSEGMKIVNTQPFLFSENTDYGAFEDRDGSLTGMDECQLLFSENQEIGKLPNRTDRPEWRAYSVPCQDFVWVELNSHDSEGDWGSGVQVVNEAGVEANLTTGIWHQKNNLKHSFLPKNQPYQVVTEAPAPDLFNVKVNQGSTEADYVLLELSYVTSEYKVHWSENESAIYPTASYATLQTSETTAHFYDASDQKLYLKAFSNDEDVLIVQNLNTKPGGPKVPLAEQAAAPVFNPAPGQYDGSVEVSMTTATADGKIYYTTDGSAPTASSTPYTGLVSVDESLILRAITLANGLRPSVSSEGDYTIEDDTDEPTVYTDEVVAVVVPETATLGEMATVEVTYSASEERELISVFQLDTPPYTVYGVDRTRVSAGSGTLSFSVPIPGITPVAQDAYQFQTFITPKGKGWNERLDNLRYYDIDATSTNGRVAQKASSALLPGSLAVYPNPLSNKDSELTLVLPSVRSSTPTVVEVYNTQGSRVHRMVLPKYDPPTIRRSVFSNPGFYLIQVHVADRHFAQRILVER